MTSRGQDKRLRATIVLLGALLVEIYWLKLRVVPDFVKLYAEFQRLPRATELRAELVNQGLQSLGFSVALVV